MSSAYGVVGDDVIAWICRGRVVPRRRRARHVAFELSGLSKCEDDCAALFVREAFDGERVERRRDVGQGGLEFLDERGEGLLRAVPELVGERRFLRVREWVGLGWIYESLRVVRSALEVLRARCSHVRARGAIGSGRGKHNLIVCVVAEGVRVLSGRASSCRVTGLEVGLGTRPCDCVMGVSPCNG